MTRSRVSIAGLVTVVAIAALGTKALRTPTPLWAGAVYTMALAGLAVGVIGIIYREGSRRAFWVGFAVFGWGYWLVALSPWLGEAIRPRLFTSTALEEFHRRITPPQPPPTPNPGIEQVVVEEFMALPAVIQLNEKVKEREHRILALRRRPQGNESAITRFEDSLKDLKTEWQDLWAAMYPVLKRRVSTNGPPTPSALQLPAGAEPELLYRVGHSLFTLLSALLGGMIAVRFHRTRDATPCPSDESSTTNPSTT